MFFLKIIDDQDKELELTEENYTSPIPKRFRWRTWAGDPEGITGEKLIAFIDDDLFPAMKNLHATGPSGDRHRVVRSVFEDAYNYMKSGQLMRQVVNKINEIDFNDMAEIQHFGDIYEQILNDLQSAMPVSTTRHALSPPSWSTASTPSPGKSYLIRPAARVAF